MKNDVLLCRDRSIGHDWDAHTWDVPGRRAGVPAAHRRVSRCTRCGSVRYELFDRNKGAIQKRSNQYKMSDAYLGLGKLTQSQVHTRLYRAGKR